MQIAWNYLDKRGASIAALSDYKTVRDIIRITPNKIRRLPEDTDNGINILRMRYNDAIEFLDWFQPAWNTLSKDEQDVLLTFYDSTDDDDPISKICDEFQIESSSAYNKKNRALAKLTALLYGKK